MNTKTITPIHVCDLIAHETVSLLSVLDEDAVPPAQWMRDGLALYAAAHQLEEETARHLNWIDDEIQRIRQTAAGQELILLIGDEQLVRTAGLPMQIEAVRELLHTTAQLESVESRTALLELVRTVTDLCGMEDALQVYGCSGRYFGRGLAVLIDILNPERIVVGSIFARSGKLMREEMEKELRKEALPESLAACTIVPAALGDRIGDYGAVVAALE